MSNINIRELALKLKLLGQELISYNSFGIVVESPNEGYKIYVLDKNNKLSIKKKAYQEYKLFSSFIIGRNGKNSYDIYINGTDRNIIANTKYTYLWAEESENISYSSPVRDMMINCDSELGHVYDIIGLTDGRGKAKLINYKGKVLQLNNKQNKLFLLGYNSNGTYNVYMLSRSIVGNYDRELIITVDKDLNRI